MCDWDSDSYWTFCNQTNRTARKPHVCGECRRTIEVGERYEDLFGKCDGDTIKLKTCTHCIAARGLLIRECDSYPLGSVREGLQEHATHEYRHSCGPEAARLYVGMKRKWQRFDSRGLMPVPALAAKGA